VWETVGDDVTIEPLNLEDSPPNNSNFALNTEGNSPAPKKGKKKGAAKPLKGKKKPKEKKITKSEMEWQKTQVLKKEVLLRANSEILEKKSLDKSLLKEKSQSIRFNDSPLIREFTKLQMDSKNYLKKQKNRKASNVSAEPEPEPQTCEKEEKVFKELTKRSSLKGSGLEFTYNFAITC